MSIDLNALNIGFKRTPDGYYVIATGIEVFNKIRDVVEKLQLKFEVIGQQVLIYTKRRSDITTLINYAKARNIKVLTR